MTYGRRIIVAIRRQLPQGPLVAPSRRSQSMSGAGTLLIQSHLHWPKHSLSTSAKEALEVLARIDTTAFRDRSDASHSESGALS